MEYIDSLHENNDLEIIGDLIEDTLEPIVYDIDNAERAEF